MENFIPEADMANWLLGVSFLGFTNALPTP